jgi:hypothetical protein
MQVWYSRCLEHKFPALWQQEAWLRQVKCKHHADKLNYISSIQMITIVTLHSSGGGYRRTPQHGDNESPKEQIHGERVGPGAPYQRGE